MATVLTSAGEAWIVDKLDDTVATNADWIGWGTGSTTAAKGDTVIETESAETRIQGAQSQPSADIMQVVSTITSLSGQTIANAGLMTAVTSGVLVVHGDFAGIVLTTDDKIEFTITLEIT